MRWLLVLALAACSASTTIDLSTVETGVTKIAPGVSMTNVSTGLAIQLDGKPAEIVAFGDAKPHALPIEGRACTLTIIGGGTTTYQNQAKQTRELMSTAVRIACTDGPAPGSQQAMRGSRAFWGLLFVIPAFALGVLAGFASRTLLQLLGALGAIAAVVIPPLLAFDGLYPLTYMVLAAGLAVVGYSQAHARRTHASASPYATLGVLAIPIVAAIFPAWSFGGPILAALVAGTIWIALIAAL